MHAGSETGGTSGVKSGTGSIQEPTATAIDGGTAEHFQTSQNQCKTEHFDFAFAPIVAAAAAGE